MRNTFRILFYIKRNALLRDGRAPIMMRVTVNGERIQISANSSIEPERWDRVRGCVRGRRSDARRINMNLETMRMRVMNCYDRLARSFEPLSAARIKELYAGGGSLCRMFLDFFREYLDEFGSMVGVSRSKSSYDKYRSVYKLLSSFVRERCADDDIPFYRLNRRFIADFHGWLGRCPRLKPNTVWVYMVGLKHVVLEARSRGYLRDNIFVNYRLRSEYVPRNYLTLEELRSVCSLSLPSESLSLVRDLFVFSCYTGLSYVDIRDLRFENLQHIDNEIWVNTSRRKTGTAVGVRLFDIPLSIMARRSGSQPDDGRIFRVPTNGYCNMCLRRIMEQAGISRRVTFHTARHTFATSVTLGQGMRIETISKLLGHKSINTTQIYASVTHAAVRSEMDLLQQRIMSGSGVPV